MGPDLMYEVIVAKDVDLATTADVGDWAPGLLPHYIHAVAVVVTNAIGATGVVKVDKRPTAGDNTGRGDGNIATVNLATTHTIGKVVYTEITPVRLDPGEEAVVEVTDAAAASDTGHIVLLVSPIWERPANITAMVAST